jgi:acetyl esterase/lipase
MSRTAPSLTIELWPDGVPGRLPDARPERIQDGLVYDVGVPTLAVFAPPAGTGTGTAAIVCPGGGYACLAVDKEGAEATRWLTSLGVTACLLKYRVAPYRHPAPLTDVLQAMRIVRSRARELGVNPSGVGIVGASAGGHLAASAATMFDASEGKTGAALDAICARPDFVVLLYPVITMAEPHAHAGSRRALLGERPSAELVARLSLERAVTAATSPAFIMHTAEDASVPIENSILFYRALRAAGVPAELHLYESGAHGFGWQAGLGPTSEWPERCADWLRFHRWLP